MSISAAAASEFVINGMLKYAESLSRIRAIQAEGRDKLTLEEWRQVVADADAARAVAQDEVDRAIAEGQ